MNRDSHCPTVDRSSSSKTFEDEDSAERSQAIDIPPDSNTIRPPVELLRWVLTQNWPPGQLVARNGQIWGFWAVFGPWRSKKCNKWCTQSGSDEKLMILEPNCKFF